jgi:polyisoprenoid-binding protein YceI
MTPITSKRLPGALLIILPILIAPVHASGESDNWHMNLSGARVSFSIRVLGMFEVGGKFEHVAGNILLDDTCTAEALTFSIDAASVNTENADLDRFLRSATLLNTENFPRVIFASRDIVMTGSGPGMITGTLTLNGITREVRFAFLRHDSPDGATRAFSTRFEASAHISRSEFGITALPVAVSDTININVSVDALPENIRIADARP